jgi:hypothetical protein
LETDVISFHGSFKVKGYWAENIDGSSIHESNLKDMIENIDTLKKFKNDQGGVE